ncbi:LCP family protein [Salinithrix halophila]|uniref:LCP family protein n=1 Tax=Salinithrix halophila TaxID=1485204 RepID=A0ABV8JKX0_9BACL
MGRFYRAGVLVLLLVISAGAYIQFRPAISPAPNTQGEQEKHPPKKPVRAYRSPVLPSPPDRPLSILLMGIDQRKRDKGRSDALMVLAINPRQKGITLLNIPRDSKANLQLGHGRTRWDKINHAYALGEGIPSTVRTVESFLDLPIQHYVKVNMAGFRSLVDLFGGVEVTVGHSFSYKGHHFKKGPMTLNGSQALAYVRDRTGGSDYNRHRRQQQVMKSLWEKGTRFSTLFKMGELAGIMTHHVETSLTPSDVWRLFVALREVPEDRVEVLRLAGTDEWGSRYYLRIPKRERIRAAHALRRRMELEPSQ